MQSCKPIRYCCVAPVYLRALCILLIVTGASRVAYGAAWPEESNASRWLDDSGQPFDLQSVRGQVTFVTMAYTRCRFVCPMVFERLEQIQQDVDARGRTAQFIIVGFAGVGETAADWHRYRLKRHLTRGNWHFLSGSEADTRHFARRFGFEFWRYDEHIMHHFQIFLFDQEGVLRAQIGEDQSAWQFPDL